MRTNHLFRGIRALCVLAILSGGLLLGPSVEAAPQITFVDCAETSPSPSPTPTPTASPSPESCTPAEGSIVRGSVPIVFEVHTGEVQDDLRKVTLSIWSDRDPDAPDAANPVRVWEGELEDGRFEYTWDSTRTPGYNGRYKVQVDASSEGLNGGSSSAERLDLRVDNPPKTPAKPRVARVTGEGVRVEWPPAQEPDVLHYTLYRARTESADQKPDASAFEERRVTEQTSVLDEVSSDGAYWYEIQVTRRSIVESDGGIASDRSARSDEPGVYVSPTPTPAPTPPPEGGNGETSGTVETTPRPRLTPKPLPRAERSGPPPPPDAPYSDTLPYDLTEEGREDGSGSGGADLAQGAEGDARERGDQGALPAVAIGTFLVSAALALGRLPTT